MEAITLDRLYIYNGNVNGFDLFYLLMYAPLDT